MPDLRNIKVRVCLKALPFLLVSVFITHARAQSDAIMVVKGETTVKSRVKDDSKGVNVGVKNIKYKVDVLEGAVIELKKNGTTVSATTSGKKGKYSFEVPVSTTDAKNDYVLYISKDGMGTKMVNINGFVSKPEFGKYPPSPKYNVELDIFLIPTTVKDAVSDKSTAKIKWDLGKEHTFVVDPGYAKVAQTEELKILADPDGYYGALAKKRKKAEDALANKKTSADAKAKAAEEAKRKAEEEARLKAEAEANRLAALKAKEEADRIEREKAAAIQVEMRRKRIADSLAELARLNAKNDPNATVDIRQIIRPVDENDEEGGEKDRYDAADKFSISIAKRSLSAEREKKSREKSRNLSAKYETINTLTSLLNEVDEYDKEHRRQ